MLCLLSVNCVVAMMTNINGDLTIGSKKEESKKLTLQEATDHCIILHQLAKSKNSHGYSFSRRLMTEAEQATCEQIFQLMLYEIEKLTETEKNN